MEKVIDLQERRGVRSLAALFSRPTPSRPFPRPDQYNALLDAYQARGQVIYDADAILSEKGQSGVMVEIDSAELDRLRRAATMIQKERLRRQPRCPE